MSDRTITQQFIVASAYQVFGAFRTRQEANDYATSIRRGAFLSRHELASLDVVTAKANR